MTNLEVKDLIAMLQFYTEKNENLSSEEMEKEITEKFKHLGLNFGKCRQFDIALTGNSNQSYWRGAYDYPKNGDEITYTDMWGVERLGIASDCGLFTFNFILNEQ